MRYEVMHGPAFAVAKVVLGPGETVRAESGAMASMSPTIEIETQSGGLGKMFGRLLTGESLFQTKFTASGGGGEVILAPKGPGEIAGIDLVQPGLMITSGCFLACDPSVELNTKAEWKGMFSGEGLFMMHASGAGTVLVSTFGAIRTIDLQPGEQYIIDTGHLVAFTAGMQMQVKKSARGFFASVASGEGYVIHLSGPGRVLMQTHNASSLASIIAPFIPSRG
ncbi:MAG: TIGR00266 family protein [Fimbriimonadaceae bacterium]|nr:TIGR00266 family protein [Fimbriimonadaceae bacterium]